jgi:MFS superfamily sulfate permease-like transporter
MVGLITLKDVRRYRRVNRADWAYFMGAMLGMLFLGIIQGILIGVVLSLLLLIARASGSALRQLGRDPTSNAFHDLARDPELEVTPGVLVVRIDGPVFFANANRIRDNIMAMVRQADPPVHAEPGTAGLSSSDRPTSRRDHLETSDAESGRAVNVQAMSHSASPAPSACPAAPGWWSQLARARNG